jgi:hypothetical protein
VWDGVVKTKPARVGLYSGKKRMFKGHKWERTMEGREKRRKVLMRDMKERILRYKTVCRGRCCLLPADALCSALPSSTTEPAETASICESAESAVLIRVVDSSHT